MCRFLEERGYTVESATNGEEALPIVKRIHPDIIITDMQMPKMGGSELITALKSQPETAKIPIVIVAGLVPFVGMILVLLLVRNTKATEQGFVKPI